MKALNIKSGSVAAEENGENRNYCSYLQENGYTVIAVADPGENSAIGSSISAATSVEEVMDSLISGLAIEDALRRAFNIVREILLNRDDVEELGCSLSVAAITPSGYGIGIVGNSFAVVSHSVDEHSLICAEESSGIRTALMTDEDFTPFFDVQESDPIAVSVGTRGLMKTATPKNGDNTHKLLESFWNSVINQSVSGDLDIEKFLECVKDEGRLSQDTSLIIASKSL